MKTVKLKPFEILVVVTLYVGVGIAGLILPKGYAASPEISLGIVLCLISNNRQIPVIALAAISLQLILGLHKQLAVSELLTTTTVYSLSVVLQCWVSNRAVRKIIGSRWKSLFEFKDIVICALIVTLGSSVIPATVNFISAPNTQDLLVTNIAIWVSDWLNNISSVTIFFPLFLSLYLRKSYGWKARWKTIVIGSVVLAAFFIFLINKKISFQYLEQNITVSKIMTQIVHSFEMHSRDLENSIELFTRVASNSTEQNDHTISDLSFILFKKFPEINAISINTYQTEKFKTDQKEGEVLQITFSPQRVNGGLVQTKKERYASAFTGKYLETLNNLNSTSDYYAFFSQTQSPVGFQVHSLIKTKKLPDTVSASPEINKKFITIHIDKQKYLANLLENISKNNFTVSIEQTSLDTAWDGEIVQGPEVVIESIESNNADKSLFESVISIDVFNTIWKIEVVPLNSWFLSRLISQRIPAETIRLFMIVCFQFMIFLAAARRSGIKLLIAKQTATILNRERGLQIFKASIQKSTDLIMICKVDTVQNNAPTIMYINEFFQFRSGYSFQELINQPWSILQTEQSDPEILHSVSQAIKAGHSHTVELLSIDKAGKWFWLNMNLSPIRDDSNIITHWVFIQHEITERIVTELLLKKSADEAHHANLAKSRFLAVMSHEIRTPLGGIIGLSRLARMQCSEHQTAEFLEKIQSSAELQLGILNNILDYSKIESKSLQLNNTLFDLEQLLRESVALYQPSAFLSGIELNRELPLNTIKFVFGDWLRIKQIIANLIGNGLKFTDQGSVVLKLEFLSLRDDQVDLRISVLDTGIGIQGTTLTELLEPFKQANSSISQNYGGTGLGLTITEQLLRLMGSRLQMKPRFDGPGTHFYFDLTLPMSRNDNEVLTLTNSTTKHHEDFNNDISVWKNVFIDKRILLAEDNDITQIVMQQFFQITGARVEVAADGQSVIEKFLANHYDVIIMDLQLPHIDGIEACKKIRSLPGGSTFPIFGVSAGITSNEADLCQAAGMVDFLHKPVDPIVLFTKLQKYFARNLLLDAEIEIQKINFLQSLDRNLLTHQQSTINLIKLNNAQSEEKLLRMFLAQAAQLEHDILEKLRSKDFEDVQKMLHEIQGAAAIFDELKLVTSAKALEDLIKNQTPDRLKIDEFKLELKISQDRILKSLNMLNSPVTLLTDQNVESSKETTTASITEQKTTHYPEPKYLDRHSSAFSILIADDNELVSHSLQQLLSCVKVKVMCVSSGEEVLKQLLINDYDLILMDIRMPGLNGIETTKRIRTQVGLNHIDIIGMSADTSTATVETCLQAGMKEVYSKLSRPEILIETVKRFINN